MGYITTSEEISNWINDKDLIIQISLGIKYIKETDNEEIHVMLNNNLEDNQKLSNLVIVHYFSYYLEELFNREYEDAMENIFTYNSDITKEEVIAYLKAATKIQVEKIKSNFRLDNR